MKKLKILVNVGNAKPGPPLGPVLGQNQINISKFCQEFNQISDVYEDDVLLRTEVRVSKGGGFYISKCVPVCSSLITQVLTPPPNEENDEYFARGSTLAFLDFQRSILVMGTFSKSYIKKSASNLLGLLQSMKVCVV